MAGLLNPQLDGVTLGLLGGAQALMTPRRQGGGVGGMFGAMGQGLLQGEELARARAAQANRDRLTNAQIAENESQAKYREAQVARSLAEAQEVARKRAEVAAFWQMMNGGGAPTGAPTKANAERAGQPMQLSPAVAAQAAALGIPLDTLTGVANAGRTKVARTVEVRGPDGRPRIIQVDEFGQPVGDGFAKAYEQKMQDVGGSVVPVDPYAPTALTKTQTPDGRASNAVAWANNALTKRGQDMTDARAQEAASAMQAGRIPSGYRMRNDGNLEFIPGGPADPAVKDGKSAVRAEGAVNRADIVIGKIDEALGKTGFFTTGLTGFIGGKLPGTEAYDLRATVDTVKANIGFQELQAMREASPTGGALGQVAVQELNMLQAVLSNLDPNQSEKTLRKNLGDARKHFENWKNVMRQSAGLPAGATGSWGGASGPVDFKDIGRKPDSRVINFVDLK